MLHCLLGPATDLGLLEGVRARGDLPVWRRDDDNRPMALRITSRGLEAIGIDGDAFEPDQKDTVPPSDAGAKAEEKASGGLHAVEHGDNLGLLRGFAGAGRGGIGRLHLPWTARHGRPCQHPGRQHYRSVRGRMPVLSAIIFVIARAGSGNCRSLGDCSMPLITIWLQVRVLPAPPRIPTLTEISRGLTNSPRFRGGVGPAYILCSEEGPLQRQFRAFCLRRPKTVSPEHGKRRPETRFACDRD
jgi:hypothetical protein